MKADLDFIEELKSIFVLLIGVAIIVVLAFCVFVLPMMMAKETKNWKWLLLYSWVVPFVVIVWKMNKVRLGIGNEVKDVDK